MAEITLKTEWEHLLALSRISLEAGLPEFEAICRAYAEPHRHYHTLTHIEHLLTNLKAVGFDSPAGLWAVWYHDYIYEPGSDSNEMRSADYAEKIMTQLGVERSIIDTTIEIILATKNHNAEAPTAEMLTVLDADMAILGESPAQYEAYRLQVKNEFQAVPAMLYKIGRRSFLESVLNQKQIYKTDWFAARYELQARQNMRNEIKYFCSE